MNNNIEGKDSNTQPVHGIDRRNMDTAANPRTDFFRYANGGWMEAHPIPGEFAAYGTFNLLRDNARHQLRELIDNLAGTPEAEVKGTNAQKVSDLYNMALDEERRNELGAAPVMPFLEKVDAWSRNDMAAEMAWLHNGLSTVFFSSGVGPHPQDSSLNILHIGEAGLSLGDRDYYLVESEENTRILAAFEIYVKRLMALTGHDEEEQQRIWNTVIKIETELAKHKKTREERRNPLLSFNMTGIGDLMRKLPGFDWKAYLEALGVGHAGEANVSSVKYLEFAVPYMLSLSDRELKDFLTYNVTADSTGVLSEDFQEADFELFGRVMSGTEEREPRWKRALAIPNSMLGEAVGELYVKKYFPESHKQHMLRLVDNLRQALADHIRNLTWMSQATKDKALAKLESMTVKIGYPDKWKDYSAIEIDPAQPYLENVYRASVWYCKDNYGKLGKPVDKSEWHMTPQTVNAYYSPVNNEICFPAAILQPPYFDPEADDAVNYGAIGVVIGHEMTHGFDDQGRQFDKDGNLNEWWTPEDASRFNELADRLAAQFDQVEVAPGVHANGRFTLGENIADQGGLRIALTAFNNATAGETPDAIDGFSPLQRFYLAYAGVWAQNIRPEEVLSRTKTDPHSLAENRVNVTLRNIAPFMEAFQVKEGDPMFLSENERTVIW